MREKDQMLSSTQSITRKVFQAVSFRSVELRTAKVLSVYKVSKYSLPTCELMIKITIGSVIYGVILDIALGCCQSQ